MSQDKVELDWEDEGDEKKAGGLSDLLKKVIATGLSSPFLSEDQLKTYLSGLNLPKEVASQILRGAKNSKDEIVHKVGNEFSKLLQKVDIVKEFKNVLRENKISIKADIEFVPKKDSEDDSKK